MSWTSRTRDVVGIDLVPEDDTHLVLDYLAAKHAASSGSYHMARRCIIEILYTVAPRPLATLTYNDLDAVAQHINTRALASNTKRQVWSTITAYYCWALDRLRGTGINVTNNLPHRVQFAASQRDVAVLGDDEDNHVMSDADLNRHETRARIHSMAAHVMFLLLKHTGMRHSEVISIRLENVHVDERYIVTGLERNARKNKRPLYFFYPAAVALRLRQYLLTLPAGTWLFPSTETPTGHITHWRGQYLFGRVHAFRHTLVTRRLDAGCPLHISELLQNHVISAVQFKNYYRKTLRERRDLYDRYHPFH